MKTNWFQRVVQKLASMRFNSWWLAKVLYRIDPIVMKRSGGRSSLTATLTGLPVVILRSIGAKSGLERISPLVGIFDGDKLILIASYFGNKNHPAWYYNLKANPEAWVEFQGQEKRYVSFEVSGKDREKLWGIA